MNILRWKRKSKKKIKFKTLILFIFSLIMTTFAWLAYSKVLNTTMNLHMASWDMEYYIGEDKKTNPIGIDIDTLYPTMPEQSVTVDIKNNGEKLVDIEHQVLSVTIIGTSYQIVYEGQKNTSENYIVIPPGVLSTDLATGKAIYKNVITNDISKFPFTIELEHSAQVAAGGQGYLKVIVNWIGDNNELDSEWGYRVGEYFTNNPDATSAISVEVSIDSYQADPEAGELVETLPITLETAPYLPTGFTRVPGTSLDTGLVITDSSGNEYVWVEVPKNTTIYDDAGINITAFTNEEYTKIETDLKEYSSAYNTRDDAFSSYRAIGVSEDNYKALKKKALKSIYQNGGFYVGRYETGIEDSFRTTQTSSTPTETAVIKANAYPFNYVTCAQAQEIANNKSTTDYTSSLMFGFQWDLIMKYLETSSSVTEGEIITDSTAWGNYKNNRYNITKTNAKYSLDNGANWLQVNADNPAYEKNIDGTTILATGSNTVFSKQNIYDLAGNMAEWTLNVGYNGSTPVGGNGGDYLAEGTNSASHRSTTYDSTTGLKQVGFRIAMFSNVHNGAVGGEGASGNTTEPGPYLPTGFSWANAGHTEIKDSSQNQYVWVSVPRDATVYNDLTDDTEDTGMSDTTNEDILAFDVNNLTTANLTAIETELKEYTATYRNGTTYKDEFYSTDQHGFANATAYNNHKNKMLESVFKNGGFYVGKYETGIADTEPDVIDTTVEARTSSSQAIADYTPVIQANAYPYNFVTNKQAQELATGMESGEYTSSLMFGLQWDLVLKHLEMKTDLEVADLNSDSTSWGNYRNNNWTIENTDSKYDVSGSNWTDGLYNGTGCKGNTTTSILLSTGASDDFERGGIYDLAGNVYEWTLEYSSFADRPCANRGGRYDDNGSGNPVNNHYSNVTTGAGHGIGFRVSLF